jgi:ribonuclease Z
MTDKEFFALQTPHFLIEGRSRAGHETFFRIRDLNLALDIGRCPDFLVHIPHIFITHAHLDHAVGIPFYAGQRHLQRLDGGRIYVPAESADDVRALLALHEKMAGTHLEEVEVIGVGVGDEIRIGRTHVVRAYRAAHRVAARAYEVIDVRHHLLPQFENADVAQLRRDGVRVEEEYRRSILFYTGDTDRGLLESCEAMFKSEVLLIECSFVIDGHQDRAAKYRHIHLDDIAEFAEKFENELVILTHFSRRYSREEIRDAVRRRLPHALRERVRLALPEPWQRA